MLFLIAKSYYSYLHSYNTRSKSRKDNSLVYLTNKRDTSCWSIKTNVQVYKIVLILESFKVFDE